MWLNVDLNCAEKWVVRVGIRAKVRNTLALELKVKLESLLWWDLLIRDRVSSTLEWVECINRYERVFVSEYKIVIYYVDWSVEWYIDSGQYE